MGYLSINNLYKDQTVLQFKEVYALEKIHGTSANVSYTNGTVNIFSGGEKYEKFAALFNKEELKAKFEEKRLDKVFFYGEAYGGKQQGMSEIYGKDLKFVVFDVKIDSYWLDVPNAAALANSLGFEFVDYVIVSTSLEALNHERDRPSVQAIRNGMGEDKPREGIVIRPITEMQDKRGERIIAKHKGEQHKETATQREVRPDNQKLLEEAQAIADEWVTENRLGHVLQKIAVTLGGELEDYFAIEHTGLVVSFMIEDVIKESTGEIVDTKGARKAIGVRGAKLFREFLQKRLKDGKD